MAKKLIIVESPAKTKTLKGFLGSDYSETFRRLLREAAQKETQAA